MLALDYTKTILEKVSFNPKLFEKELSKAQKQLLTQEWEELTSWCRQKFDQSYTKIIDKISRK